MATSDKDKAVTKKEGGNVVAYDDSLYETDVDVQDEIDDVEDEDSGGPEDRLVGGRNVRRILPPPKGSTWGAKGKPSCFKKTWEHRIMVPGAKRPITFNCPRRMRKEACPVCDKATGLENTGNPLDRDMAYELFPSRKYRCNWVNRDESKEKDGPRVGKFGIKLYSQILDLHEECGLSFLPSAKGYDLVIKRKGEERDTEYKALKGTSCTLHDDPAIGNEWIADQYDLEAFAECPDEDGLDDLMESVEKVLGRKKGRGRDDDRGGSRRRSSSGSSSRRKRDDDDEDEERGSRRGGKKDDDDEDDEKESGGRRRRSSRSAQEDTEDDEKDK